MHNRQEHEERKHDNVDVYVFPFAPHKPNQQIRHKSKRKPRRDRVSKRHQNNYQKCRYGDSGVFKIYISELAKHQLGASAAVGMRLHFAVLSALWGTPLVVLPYDPKVEAFARAVEVPCAGEEELPEPRPPIPSDRLGAVFEVDALCHAVLSRN